MSQPSPVEPLSDANDISFTPPRWVSWLIALIPVFPPLYLVAFASLGLLRTLPLTARYVLFFFTSTQLVAALFTPRPLLSLVLATARILLILAMISAGIYLRDSQNLRPLLWGQLIIFTTAWGYTLFTQGFAGVQARLGHPYYYVVSLGLVAVIALWTIIFWRGGSLWWRIPAGVFVSTTFLAAGSRGPFLALMMGSLAILGIKKSRRRWWAIIPTLVILSLVLLGNISNIPFNPLNRLLNDQTTGREYIWKDALAGWHTSIAGGVGAYQGGPYLTYLFNDGCQLTPTLSLNQIKCPESLSRLASVWLIAHNFWLHWLLEAGIIGLTGLIILNLYVVFATINKSSSFDLAIIFGFMAMNLVDVVSLPPSPHFAELWWVIVGIILSRYRPSQISITRSKVLKLCNTSI